VKAYLAAVRRASTVLDVPGTPTTLRLDDARSIGGDVVLLSWSFADPEVFSGDKKPHGRRVKGDLTVRAEGDPEEAARTWWAEAQLSAGHRYKRQIDADWTPGEPYVRRVWTRDEAWEALLSHLRSTWDEVVVEEGGIRVVDGREEVVFRIDRDQWAEYLTDPVTDQAPRRTDVVPVATPMDRGLPLRAVDDLEEAAGAWGPVVGLVEGRIVGLGSPDPDGHE
jgi:hypothetical protein